MAIVLGFNVYSVHTVLQTDVYLHFAYGENSRERKKKKLHEKQRERRGGRGRKKGREKERKKEIQIGNFLFVHQV